MDPDEQGKMEILMGVHGCVIVHGGAKIMQDQLKRMIRCQIILLNPH
jgi:hypothetical protein